MIKNENEVKNPLQPLVDATVAYQVCTRVRGVKSESDMCVCCKNSSTCLSPHRAEGGKPGVCQYGLDTRNIFETEARVMSFLQRAAA